MNRFNYLIMVTPNNNNKYYKMEYNGEGNTFNITYGRVNVTEIKETNLISKYDSILKSKIKKGYKDITDLMVEEDSKVIKTDNEFLCLMEKYRKNLINNTYLSKVVTKKQKEECQSLLNQISKDKTKPKDEVNSLILNLYSIIPRKMLNVNDFLLPNINLDLFIQKEQDNIDALTIKEQEYINIDIKEVKEEIKEISYLLEQTPYYSNKKIKDMNIKVYSINNLENQQKFNKFNKEYNKILVHGTRNSSVLSILEQGLKIRPTSNFTFSGKVYGNGVYFSEVVKKSLNYTGNDKDKVLLVYDVYVGNPYVYKGYYNGNDFELNEIELKKRGFDSTFVEAGNGLLNSEIIIYNEEQFLLKYIIHLNEFFR